MSDDPHACICKPPYPRQFSNWPEGVLGHQMKCPQDMAAGLMCATHFNRIRDDRPKQWEVNECADCQAAKQTQAEYMQQHCTIDPDQPYGHHIALTCRNHPSLRWSTKNIDFIGARSLFFLTPATLECPCPASDLIVYKEEPCSQK
jgi:hypothetical protein